MMNQLTQRIHTFLSKPFFSDPRTLLGLWLLLVVLPTWRVRMTPRELEVSVGVLFPVLHRMPRLTVCGLQRVTTPVLRRAGLCLAWVHGAGGQTCLLPLLPAEDLDALCRALGL